MLTLIRDSATSVTDEYEIGNLAQYTGYINFRISLVNLCLCKPGRKKIGNSCVRVLYSGHLDVIFSKLALFEKPSKKCLSSEYLGKN